MWLTVEERVFILERYLKTMSYVHCRQSYFEKFRRQVPVKSGIAKILFMGIQPLGRSGQRPELSQATGMALVRCILGKFLGVVCNSVNKLLILKYGP